jgi:hypothetical protein
VNTSELAAKIAEADSVSKTQAQAILDSMLKTILGAAANGEEILASWIREVQSQGNAGTRGAQSDQRRENQDRRLAQTKLFACKGGEGAPERLSAGAKPRAEFAYRAGERNGGLWHCLVTSANDGYLGRD